MCDFHFLFFSDIRQIRDATFVNHIIKKRVALNKFDLQSNFTS